MQVECLARRMHAPFQGLLQLVRIPHGEAESTDGVRWVLYVSHDTIVSHSGLSEVRFGDWSAATGLHRAVVRGTAPSTIIEDIGCALVGALERHARQVPFAPADSREYWLLDREGEPLALLNSALEGETLDQALAVWVSGQAARTRFQAPGGDALALEAQVARRAGNHPRAAWFVRHADGRVEDLRDGVATMRDDLPRWLLSERWSSPAEAKLVAAYQQWMAAALLQLHSLSDAERRSMERCCGLRPDMVERVHRLYPRVIDPAAITAARVRARMEAGKPEAGYSEPFHWQYHFAE